MTHPEEKRDNTNSKSTLRYVRCEETGDMVDQHGRGFRDEGQQLVPTGRLYIRTATSAKLDKSANPTAPPAPRPMMKPRTKIQARPETAPPQVIEPEDHPDFGTRPTPPPVPHKATHRPTDTGIEPQSAASSFSMVIQSPPLVLLRLDLQKLTPEFFRESDPARVLNTHGPDVQPPWFLVQFQNSFAAGPIGETRDGQYCVRAALGNYYRVMDSNGHIFNTVKAIFLLPQPK